MNKLKLTSKLIFVVLFLLPINYKAYSYNKENHEIITRTAINLLRLKHGDDYISYKTEKKLIRGNLSEDKFGIKWLNRLWNQHFYNPIKKEELQSRPKSINYRFNRIADRCGNKINSSRYYHYVGEVIHHIQDVTNPAHVVPIYHGGSKKDVFDEQNIDSIISFISKNWASDAEMKEFQFNHESILSPIALKTLNNLDNKFEVEIKDGNIIENKEFNWHCFWKANDNGWFGKYGYLGKSRNRGQKNDNYGSSKIIIEGKEYTIDNKFYNEFSTKQIQLAIRETMKFIEFSIDLKNKEKKD